MKVLISLNDSSGGIFVEFGSKEMTHAERGALVAQSILKRSIIPFPNNLLVAQAAIAIGMMQDHGKLKCRK